MTVFSLHVGFEPVLVGLAAAVLLACAQRGGVKSSTGALCLHVHGASKGQGWGWKRACRGEQDRGPVAGVDRSRLPLRAGGRAVE